MDCLTSRILFSEIFQLQISVLHQIVCIFKADLSGLSDDCTKYKATVPDVSNPNQNIERACISKLKFTVHKRFIHQKDAEKLVKDELWAITKFRISSGRYHFRLLVFASSGE